MRTQVTLVDASGTWSQNVLVEADSESPAEEIAGALGALSPGQLFLDGRPFGTQGRVADSGLRDGAVLQILPEREMSAGSMPTISVQTGRETAGWELAVVSGPAAGVRIPLIAPEAKIGRDATALVRLDHHSVSRSHARLWWQPSGGSGTWVIEDLGSANGTWVNGRRVEGPTTLEPGVAVEVGAYVLEVRPAAVADADVHVAEDGTLAFNRPPRLQPASRQPSVEVPANPAQPDPTPFPWIQALVPLALGGFLYATTHALATLAFIAMSPVLVVSSTITQRRRNATKARDDQGAYESKVAAARAQVAAAASQEQLAERAHWPDPAATAAVVEGPGRRLWERRADDPDALVLRVGVHDRPAAVRLTGGNSSSARGEAAVIVPTLYSMPVTVDLKAAGVIGVAGDERSTRSFARWLVAQLAAWHTPRELELCLFVPEETAEDWDWVRWLPHARSDVAGTAPVRVGNDDDSRDQRLKELLALLDARRSASRDNALWTPSVVVVFDGVRELRALPGVPRLLREGPALGIYSIGLDRDPARLAGEARAEVVFEPSGLTATMRVDGHDPVEGVLADLVGSAYCERMARRLAPVRDAGGTDGGAALPSSVRFVDLVGVDLDDPGAVVARWRAGGRTTLAPVGVSIEGTFSLDLQRDGPHALVAGTTGSGKSEFLQTLVTSLALANRPDAIQFVLVDYKGASAFADCAELPHTVGMVTNLDGRETQRALASLEAELHRREACLNQLRAADVNTAWENDPRRAGEMGLARLVLVIDEFAELVHELPDFVTGLIRIARVGRSLGVHLILATQRPSGVVSGEMRANTGLRVALRMEDPGDSREVIEAASAAGISRSTPGRAYARTGGGARIVAFQSARVAGRRKGADANLPPPQVMPLPWAHLGFPVAFRTLTGADTGQATDLHALVALVGKAAEEAGIPRGRSPWLEPLPNQLGLASVLEHDPVGEERRRRDPGRWVVLGLSDLPAEQRQMVAEVDLESEGGLLVFGSGGSGKTTLLRTIAAGLCVQGNPDQVRLYLLDFAGRSLAQLDELPHVAAVATGDDLERVTRILTTLRHELERRRRLLAEARVESVSALRARAQDDDLPRLVLLLDGYAGFHSTFEAGTLYPWVLQLVQLITEGRNVGIHVVVTNNRLLGMPAAMTSAIAARVVMRMATADELISLGVPREAASGPGLGDGRCFVGGSTETQIATVSADPSGIAQADGVADLARQLLASGVSSGPGLPSLPEQVELCAKASEPLHFPLGLADLTLDTVDIDVTYANFVVTGPPLSGRSTALETAVAGIRASTPGVRLVGVGSMTSPLARADHWDLAGFGRARQAAALAEAAQLVAGYEGDEVRVVLVIDAVEDVDAMELNVHLEPLLRSDAVRVIAACDPGTLERAFGGWMTQLKRNRTVLVLQPASVADVEEQTRARPSLRPGQQFPPGRGVVVSRGQATLIQVGYQP